MPNAPTALPSPDDLNLFAGGSRTVKQACRESGLSRDELWGLMTSGKVRFAVKDLKRTRLVAWSDVVRYVASLYAASNSTTRG